MRLRIAVLPIALPSPMGAHHDVIRSESLQWLGDQLHHHAHRGKTDLVGKRCDLLMGAAGDVAEAAGHFTRR